VKSVSTCECNWCVCVDVQSLSVGGPPQHSSQQYVGPPFGPPDGPPHMSGDPGMGPPGPPGPGEGPGDMGGGSALANVELWVQQQNATLQEGPFSPSFGPTSQPPGVPVGHRARSNAGDGLPPRACCPGPHHPGADFGPGGPAGDAMFGGPQPPPGYALEAHQAHMMRNMAGARVPDENLTPEQLQRREEQLAQLQKIKQMLFPEKQAVGFEGGPPPRYASGPPPGMYRGPGPSEDMPPHHHMMGQPPQRFMHPGGGPGMMVAPPGGMMDQPVPPDGMIMMGGMGPPPFPEHGLPPNWEMMTNEEREWFRLQQEYYMEQRQKRQIQMQQQMAAAGGGQQPPPGFFDDMPRGQPPGRTSGPLSPVSPSFNGASPNDPQGYFFQGQPGMNFPLDRPPNFPPNGPGGPPPPNFNPEFAHHPDAGGFPPYGNPMMMQEPGAPFPGGRFPPMCGGGTSKPKRKRGSAAACMPCPGDRPGDDIFRHLQPAPSPQQFCSLNLFDGQELTITKQLNLAYQEPTASSSPSTQPPSSTPPTTAPSRKKKKTNNDVRIKSEMTEAGASLSPSVGPTASESGDLSSDRPVVSPSVSSSGGRSGGGSGPITSATLASLARGVESLQDRIQADMLRGGPFGAVQMPEPDEIGEGESERRPNAGAGGSTTDPSRTQRCATDGAPLQSIAENVPPASDQSPTSVKQDPSSLLSPSQPTQNDSIPSSGGRMVAASTSGGASVQSPGGMVGNASVQIEPRAPNTIQYLPTRPPASSDLVDQPGGIDRLSMPPESGGEVFRQVPPSQFCPNGPAGMLPPGYDGPVPPGYTGPMGRFEPVYGEPLSPGTMASRGCGPMPVQFPGGEMMFPAEGGPSGGPAGYPDGPMMHSGPAGSGIPYHGGRPMFYRGGGPVPPQAGPMYRPGHPSGMMVLPPEFREGVPDRHSGPLMPMGGMPRPGGGQMVMMGPGRPVLPPEQPPMPPNPAPARSRTESRSKKSKESKRRAEAAAARQNTAAMCEDPAAAAMMAGRPDQRGPSAGPFGGPPGSMPGPPMGFPPTDGPGGMVVERMRPGPPMMVGPDGSPGMMRHPGDPGVMMMSPEEFEMLRSTGGGPPPGMMTGDGRMLVHRGGPGGMRTTDQGMMMMMAGKGGMRPIDGEMIPGGPQMMVPLGPHEMEMRGGDPGMMPAGEMRPGSGMMISEMRGGPAMIGPGEMRPGPSGGMMGPREIRPGSGPMMVPGELRPGSTAMPLSEGRPGSGMMMPVEMNPGPGSVGDPHRPGSGMVVMSPRDDNSGGDGSKPRQGNGKTGSVHQLSDGSRPESIGKRSEVEMMQISAENAMRMSQNMIPSQGSVRPGSKLQAPVDGEMRPNSVTGMEQLMDGGMRPDSAAMMGGPLDGPRGRTSTDMILTSDGSMRPGSALMMGIGPGDNLRPRSEAMLDPLEMGMRPGAEMMMGMGPGDGSRLSGGPVMMNEGGGMRPGPQDMIGMSLGDGRMRPGSAAMMAGMGPGASEGAAMMNPMNPSDPGGMIMMGPGGEGMPMMGPMNPAMDFDPRAEMMNAQRMGAMGPRMMSPNDPGMRYDGASPMMQMRMNRPPRGELDFRMMGGGMEPGVRGVQYAPGIRNGGMYPQDRQSMMMIMGGGGAGPNPGGPMSANEFGPGMGPPMGPSDGAQFQQFQQQLYAAKGGGHHPQQGGPPSPGMMMMMDSRAGAGGNFPGFDPIQNGPPVRFGPP